MSFFNLLECRELIKYSVTNERVLIGLIAAYGVLWSKKVYVCFRGRRMDQRRTVAG